MNKFESNKPVGWTEAQKNGKGKKKRGSRGKGIKIKESTEEVKRDNTTEEKSTSIDFNFCPTCGTPANQTRKKRRYQKDLKPDGKSAERKGTGKPKRKDSAILKTPSAYAGGKRANKRSKGRIANGNELDKEMEVANVCAELCKDGFLLEESFDVENQRKQYRVLEGREKVAEMDDLRRLVKAFAKLSGRYDGFEWCEVETKGNKLLEAVGFDEQWQWEKTNGNRTLPVLWEIGAYLINYIKARQDVKRGEDIDIKTWFQVSSLPVDDPLRRIIPRGQIIEEATWHMDCRGFVREDWGDQ